jgi:hypothetical protein
MPVSVGFRAFRPASSFGNGGYGLTPQPGTFHTANVRWHFKKNTHPVNLELKNISLTKKT